MGPKVGDETIRNVNLGPASDPLLGQVIESYKVESLVGSGAMGMVYRGVHQIIGKAVAIKVLKADYSDDPEMVQRLIREARTVNAIRHPAIVDIFGFGTIQRTEQPYIVMDLLEGDPLDEYLKLHAPMKLRQVAPFLDELLSALSAAHAVGVIHRDLKPGNVFVESKPDGQKGIKVIDFGLAKQADRAGGSVKPTNPGTLLGTPAFMAPEQVLGTKVTPATDLYAVGGIAYQMLTNHLPHEGPSAIEVLSQKMAHDPIRPRQWQPSMDEELDDWVMRLLSREPEKRYQEAEDARRALRRISDGRTGSSGKSVALNRSTTGVVPRREWGEAKTLVTESASNDKGSEVSTNDHVSPWAATNVAHDVPEPEPSSSGNRPRFQSSRGFELPTMAVNPEEVVRSQSPKRRPASQPTLPPIVESDPADQTDILGPVAAQPPTSRVPLYIALLLAIVALLSGLIWLVSQR
ncbi:MAG: serine/threonine-protein kinase [Archangium sp.]|nr:serine/threonine-protein kinase [Archangium sp.]MDP3575671.1 serine/threonine-protein kinase [Archangium sp.]